MQWKRVTALCQGVAAGVLWACGMLQGAVEAQDSQHTQTQNTSKPKKSKNPTTDATSSQATPAAQVSGAASKAKKANAPSLDTTSSQPSAPAEVNRAVSKAKKAKATSLDATSSHSADRAVAGEGPSTVAPVKNASNAEIQSAQAAGQVWVNTSSGVYHKSGHWFGATKEGKFMTEQDAIKAGYRRKTKSSSHRGWVFFSSPP